ncbi:MAG: EamA family transporter [Myxococcales bacterium]
MALLDAGERSGGGAQKEAAVGFLLVSAAAVGWGTWTLFFRGSGIPASWQSILILLVVAALSLPRALGGGGRPHGLRRRPILWIWVAVLGLCDAGNYICFFTAVDRGPIAVAVITHYLAPVIVAVLAPRLLREPLGRRTPPALLGALAGLVLLVSGSGGVSGAALPAAMFGGASALFYGVNTILGKRLLLDFSPAELLSFHSLVAALALLPLARGGPPELHALLGRPLAGAVLIGYGCGALFLAGLRRAPAQRVAVLTYLEPLVATAVGALVFRESMSPLSLFGGALILAGGAAIVLEPVRTAVQHSSESTQGSIPTRRA